MVAFIRCPAQSAGLADGQREAYKSMIGCWLGVWIILLAPTALDEVSNDSEGASADECAGEYGLIPVSGQNGATNQTQCRNKSVVHPTDGILRSLLKTFPFPTMAMGLLGLCH